MSVRYVEMMLDLQLKETSLWPVMNVLSQYADLATIMKEKMETNAAHNAKLDTKD